MTDQVQKVATAEEAVAYIRDHLLTGKLVMAEASKQLGWTFPRIRSRAKTICRALGGEFTKEMRGVYFCKNNSDSAPTSPEITIAETEKILMDAKSNG